MDVPGYHYLNDIVQSAIHAVFPDVLFNKLWNDPFFQTSLLKSGKPYLFGSGKASAAMAAALHRLDPGRFNRILVIAPETEHIYPSAVRILFGTHPHISLETLNSSKILLKEMNALQESDSFLFLLSGGASSLFEVLRPGVDLDKYRALVRHCMNSGMDIQTLNRIRTILSEVKGGKAARNIKALGQVFIISDVMGNDLSLIGSGPFYQTHSSQIALREIWNSFKLDSFIPWLDVDAVNQAVFREPRFPHTILADNRTAVQAAANAANKAGYNCKIYYDSLQGEASLLGQTIAFTIREQFHAMQPGTRLSLVYGGETTVTVQGNGIGGRNQELLLSLLINLGLKENIQAAALGTDGKDGMSEAAGAWFDLNSSLYNEKFYTKARKALKNNDSSTFFKNYNLQIKTGLTGTNVSDLLIILMEK